MNTLTRARLAVVAAALALGLGIAACGSDSSSTTSGSSAGGVPPDVASAVTAAKKPITQFPGPTTPVKPPPGKKVVVVTCSAQGAGCVRAAQGATEAGKTLGWNVQTINGDGTPGGWNSAILSAVSSNADGIVLDAVPPQLVGDALAKAKQAGIPQVSVFNPKPDAASDVFAYVTPDHTAQGVAMANWIIEDSGGNAKIVLVEDKEFPELNERVAGFKDELGKCSGCEIVTSINSQIGTMAQQLPQAVVSALQANPDANYVASPFDSNAMFAAQGVQQAGKSGQVKVTGYEGDASALESIRGGGDQVATVGDPAEWMGWQAIDELARALTGGQPENTPVSWRLIDDSNVPDTEGYQGDLDYQAQFEKLWGASN